MNQGTAEASNPSPRKSSEETTVHLILNAHIDPVWLWPWQGGMDEALATCRSACDRLDRHPDVVFTRGEAWIYQVVERIDPPLFERIKRHVEAGRWEIVGGWWIQPDCNLPGELGMRRQIELGRDYFLSRFGLFTRIAYNVDSFGHAAALPRLMRAYGQDRYVMMRPQEHEMALPARLFRWRGNGEDPDVVVFRIAHNYETSEISDAHVLASLEALPTEARHTMCFVGVGDHGGGPTERQIAWCREHEYAFAGSRLVFSSPSRFFDAIEAQELSLETVTGELQHHAIGCYTVTRSVKTGVREAEHRLRQAELVAASDPGADGAQERINEGWRQVCFNHFHDTLGGTCIPSAYPQIEDQLGSAKATADEIIQFGFRRRAAGLPDDARQRLVLLNASDSPFRGYVTLAPWTEEPWRPDWRVLDASGGAIAYQLIEQEALAIYLPRLLTHIELAAGELASLLVDRGPQPPLAAPPSLNAARVANEDGRLVAGNAVVAFPDGPAMRFGELEIEPVLRLIEDTTGTWAHGEERFDGESLAVAHWGAPEPVHRGPLMASTVQRGGVERSDILADWRVYAGEALVELRLRVNWFALHRVLKLDLTFPEDIAGRLDGVMGGVLDRGLERRERPLRDLTLIRLGSGVRVGVVCPDVFALDAEARAIRLTLLRSPFMGHHHPSHPATPPHARPADQGLHDFRFQFFASKDLTSDALERRALALHCPPLASDLTKGMAARSRY